MSRTWTALPAPAALMAAARRELTELAQLLTAAQPGSSVHGARRRIKQLRSLLRLLRPLLGEEAWRDCNAALREAADALAGHRRAEALVSAAGRLDPQAATGFWLLQAEQHRHAHTTGGEQTTALAAARDAAARAGDLLNTMDVDVSAEAVAETFLATYAKARRRLRAGLRSEAPEDLHEARKFVIHHLHHLKLLFPGHVPRHKALEALREVLGDLNDLDELQQIATGTVPPAADARRMRKARARLLARTERAADRLFRHKAERIAKRLRHAAKPHSRSTPLALEAGE